ncbi:helix-turn-helix domain-containing protein [Halobellus ordinarius]|uniref:helix-turn-helix domain-containing protein n=1 Tax=Halobellus ordinarius TaxID=3075120 RepID=UPI002880353E|nr:helix-turn-helix domain-containing protein [Halobellus sp. ZY16]
MSENPLSDALEPDPSTVFAALKNGQCQQVLRSLDTPMTATEIAEACDLPRSTVYGKLERMVEAGLLRKHDREEAARYTVDFEEVVVRNPNGDLELEITPPSRSAAEQLSELWGEVRAESRGD